MREPVDAERVHLFMRALIERGLVDRARLAELFDEIEPELYRFPAIDPASCGRRVAAAARG
jgi:hypothetical protein